MRAGKGCEFEQKREKVNERDEDERIVELSRLSPGLDGVDERSKSIRSEEAVGEDESSVVNSSEVVAAERIKTRTRSASFERKETKRSVA